jgi:WD40 repeat protein
MNIRAACSRSASCFGRNFLLLALFIYAVLGSSARGEAISTPLRQFGYGRLLCTRLSPDGTKFLTGSADGVVRLWDVANAQVLRTFSGHGGQVGAVAFSPDGNRILTGSADKTARLWDAATGKQLLTLTGHTDVVSAVAVSPDGTRLLTGSDDAMVRLWDAATGQPLRTYPGTDYPYCQIPSIAFSPDGSKVAACASRLSEVHVWDTATGQPLKQLFGENMVVFSPDGTKLATFVDQSVVIYDVKTANPLQKIICYGGTPRSIAFAPDGAKIALGIEAYDGLYGTGGAIGFFDISTGLLQKVIKSHWSYVQSVDFSSDGSRMLTGSNDQTVKLWDTATGAELRAYTGHTEWVYSLAFSPDGLKILTGAADVNVYAADTRPARLWSIQSGQVIQTFPAAWEAMGVAFAPYGAEVLVGSRMSEMKLWNGDSGQLLGRTFIDGGVEACGSSVAFAPNGAGSILAAGDSLQLFERSTGKRLWRSKPWLMESSGVHYYYLQAAFSPDGKKILSNDYFNMARLWSVATGDQILTCTGHTAKVRGVAFAPDGRTVLTGSEDKTVRQWDSSTAKLLRTFTLGSGVWAVAYSPDGTKILAGCADNTARLLDRATGQVLFTYTGHCQTVGAVAFSPDGLKVLTGSEDGTTRLWRTGKNDARHWSGYQ